MRCVTAERFALLRSQLIYLEPLQQNAALGGIYIQSYHGRVVFEDDPRRHAFAKHLFLSEIEYQAQFAAEAAERLSTCTDAADSVKIWSAVQSILIAAANVSKILWPQHKARKRGAMLRAVLEVDDSNALASRSFRNHFEHYDERIDEWLISNHSVVYVDQIVGSLYGFPGEFSPTANRSYDPLTQTLAFRGQSMNLQAILEALDEMRRKCQNIMQV